MKKLLCLFILQICNYFKQISELKTKFHDPEKTEQEKIELLTILGQNCLRDTESTKNINLNINMLAKQP